MERRELIWPLVLNSICDDFENVDQIILRDGSPFGGELPGLPALDVAEEDFQTHFYTTKKGIDFHLADDSWWPFDDGDDED
jgi:hypothetical protein